MGHHTAERGLGLGREEQVEGFGTQRTVVDFHKLVVDCRRREELLEPVEEVVEHLGNIQVERQLARGPRQPLWAWVGRR